GACSKGTYKESGINSHSPSIFLTMAATPECARVDAMAVDAMDGRGSAALCQRARAFLLALEQEAAQLGPPPTPLVVKRLKLMTLAMLMGLIARCPAPSVALLAKDALEDMRLL
ncbi:unnamed protein product, partial [Effrenium voratum]